MFVVWCCSGLLFFLCVFVLVSAFYMYRVVLVCYCVVVFAVFRVGYVVCCLLLCV